ncbi:MAG: hypothetical protein RLZZ09_1824 [Pseudomonadota bacterium]|jgi:hypothetical protein
MSELHHQTALADAAFALISSGRLPPASGFSPTTDEPLWSLGSLAAVLGIGLDDLLDHLRAAPPRFEVTAPKGGAGEYRMLAR